MNDTPSVPYDYQSEGGALLIDAPTYVKRKADDELYEGLKAGQFCYVLNARQMGKSSLKVRTLQQLRDEGIACAAVDLQGIGTSATEEQWYFGVISRIARSLGLHRQFDLNTWWTEQPRLSYVQRFVEFVESLLLPSVPQPIVIFIDEVDLTLSLPFRDDFFGALRESYNRRADELEYRRLTFALFGVATPSDLIQNKQITPFNIGRPIDLTGFQSEEAQPLIPGLAGKTSHPQALLQAFLDWTGGQPFLTQKLCKLAQVADSEPLAGQESQWVEQLVQTKVIDNWETQDIPPHLKTIRDRLLLGGEQRTGRLLGLYQQILQQGEVAVDDSPEQVELRLTGLVLKGDGKLRVYNRIYEQVFNRDWLERSLAELRPYGGAIAAWLKSGCQDESRLLRGQALQDARTWAEGKSLGDEDYRFLTACQVADQKIALVAEQKAREELSELLAKLISLNTPQSFFTQIPASVIQVQKRLRNQNRRVGASIALAVASLVLGIRQLGGLELLELKSYDLFLQARPKESLESRLLIVTIDNDDLETLQQSPLHDGTIADALERLESYQPRAIGLDISRDTPQGSQAERTRLTKVISKSQVIVSICSLSSENYPGSPPAPGTSDDRVAFANLPFDRDNIVRRSILVSRPGGHKSSPRRLHVCNRDEETNELPSLSFLLALMYLEALGIQAEPSDGGEIKFHNQVISRMKFNFGGYTGDFSDYEIMLNYRGAKQVFQEVSITDILSDRIDPRAIRDKIVLIGYTSNSIDGMSTPYHETEPGLGTMPGVIVHAHAASQIVSSVLDSRPLISSWAEWSEWLWVISWITIAAIAPFIYQRAVYLFLVTVILIIILIVICYLSLLFGLWLPFASPFVAIVITIASITTPRQFSEYRLRAAIHLLKTINPEN